MYCSIVFHASYEFSGRFLVFHFAVCGADCGLLEYAEKEGVITSPLYPEQYPSNLNCTYVVRSSPRSSITIIFDVLDIELAENCTYDNISVSYRT